MSLMSLKRRLERLEACPAPECVLGVQIGSGPVSTCAGEMTEDEFRARYPRGHLLCVVVVNEPRPGSVRRLSAGPETVSRS